MYSGEMRRTPVESKSIASIGFAAHRGELEVEFRQSGDVYRYSEVSAKEHADFMAAESKGTYLNQVFKLKEHPYVVVKRGQDTS